VSGCNAYRIEYHIIDVGNPESHSCRQACQQLQKFDSDAEEHTGEDYPPEAVIGYERQPEPERHHEENVEERRPQVFTREGDKGHKVDAFGGGYSLHHKVWHEVLNKEQ